MTTQPPATFGAKAQAEIDQNAFAAKTGGLVTLSAPTFWELFEAAKAWQEHAKVKELRRQRKNQQSATAT